MTIADDVLADDAVQTAADLMPGLDAEIAENARECAAARTKAEAFADWRRGLEAHGAKLAVAREWFREHPDATIDDVKAEVESAEARIAAAEAELERCNTALAGAQRKLQDAEAVVRFLRQMEANGGDQALAM